MGYYFRAQLDASDNPYFRPQSQQGIANAGGSRSLALGLGSNSGGQAINAGGVTIAVRIGGANSGFVTLISDVAAVALSLGSNSFSVDESQLGDGATGFALSLGENDTYQEQFGSAEALDLALGDNSFSINTSTPGDLMAIAEVLRSVLPEFQAAIVAELKADLPNMVNYAMRSYAIRPGVTVHKKELAEAAAIFGRHRGGKLLPGQVLPVSPTDVMDYTDPSNPNEPVIRYQIDANGNRVPIEIRGEEEPQ